MSEGHQAGRWCSDLHCMKCYGADAWQKSEVLTLKAELAAAKEDLATMTERYNVAAMNALDATAELAKVAAARGQAEAERDALRAENAKLRAALAIVHFKQAPLQ